MASERRSNESFSLGGSTLLTELATDFIKQRITLLDAWRDRLGDAHPLGKPAGADAAREANTLFDSYLQVLETGSVHALETYARLTVEQHHPRRTSTAALLSALLLLRDVLSRTLAARFAQSPARLAAALDVFEPAANRISAAVAVGVVEEHERVIREQQEAIRALSTPVLQVREGLLIHPIIGLVDASRAQQLAEQLLQRIRLSRAKVVVMDVTGVPSMDAMVATHLVQTVEAARLLGATVIVTGLSAEVARALVTVGIDVSAIHAVGDLQGGLEAAEAMLGYVVVRQSPVLAGAHLA